ncbi:glycosyltransferase [Gloeocapsopsis dulcis]|uniref:Glycosyl transferase n=1 Tax=Gloeocapsopsis dulcis AAB1 = 1H9 TaxID=1433147 RepID=A0A6N8FTR7_9CHRO|nr:glycosyltransferase [Gloeocapsopsis dulcis]MUL35705.1 glycosyl transferase [Gloeocapsopsis dulcis AAB1 = 1H9]WNN91012.1 glycosyltransferase [Gloeocapsopsis dulcis]
MNLTVKPFHQSPTINSIQKNTSISILLPNLDGGGAELVMLRLARGLANLGIKVDLVLARTEGAYLTKVPANVRMVDLKSKSPVILFKTFALRRYLQQQQPDILLSALDIVSAGTWAKLLAGVDTRVVMCVHTNLSQQFRDKPDVFVGRVRATLVRWFYPWADAIIAVSQGVAQDLACVAGLQVQNIQVIYNPVVTPEVLKQAKEPLNHPWFAPGEPPVILGVGRLVRQKDFATLVRAFALVRQRCAARLMILGDVDKREPAIKPQLEALVQQLGLEGEVALPGFVENPYPYMAQAGVFVLSSIYEGFGNVVAEAIATGTSVVATNCESGPAEILENGKYGKLVAVGDATALAEAIVTTLRNPTNPEILRQRSQVFSMDSVVAQYLEVLSNLINHEHH